MEEKREQKSAEEKGERDRGVARRRR